MRRIKFLALVTLVAAGCMTAGEKSTCDEPETLTVHDTLTVVKRDTVRLHDTTIVTKRDTLRIHDTIKVTLRDTLKVLANVTDPGEILGVWDGLSGTQKVTLAFTEGTAFIDFSGSLNGTAISGYITSLDNGQAKVIHAGYKDVTWLLALEDGVLIIEEIGVKAFAGQATQLKKR